MSTVFEGFSHHWSSLMNEEQENAKDNGDHEEEACLMAVVKEPATECRK